MKIAYTVCTANYLAQAKSLADSLVKHNPDYQFFIGLIDRIDGRFDVSFFAPHRIVEVEEWNIPFFTEMNEKYTIFELSNALKPYFADYLLQSLDAIQILVYLDSDMLVFHTFEHVEDELKRYSIALTPHILTPIPDDHALPRENAFLNAGIFNGGFLALKPDKNSVDFIKWWKIVLKDYCWVKVDQGYFVDQLWLNLVPIFFEDVCVVKHPGYNVAYYNLHERHLSAKQDTYWINSDMPLVLYHYTGYDIKEQTVLSKHQNRFSFDYRTDVLPLYELYFKKLSQNNYYFFTNLDYHYGFIKRMQEQRERELQAEKERQQQQAQKEAQEKFWQDIVTLVKKEVAKESQRLQSKNLMFRIRKKLSQYLF